MDDSHRTGPEPSTPLRRVRVARGLSQVELAAKAGVGLTLINIAERTKFLTVRAAERLAAALGVAPEELEPAAPRKVGRPRCSAAEGRA